MESFCIFCFSILKFHSFDWFLKPNVFISINKAGTICLIMTLVMCRFYLSFLIDLVIDCGQIVVKLCYLFMLLFIEFHFFAKFNSFQLNQFFVLQYRRRKNHLLSIFFGAVVFIGFFHDFLHQNFKYYSTD